MIIKWQGAKRRGGDKCKGQGDETQDRSYDCGRNKTSGRGPNAQTKTTLGEGVGCGHPCTNRGKEAARATLHQSTGEVRNPASNKVQGGGNRDEGPRSSLQDSWHNSPAPQQRSHSPLCGTLSRATFLLIQKDRGPVAERTRSRPGRRKIMEAESVLCRGPCETCFSNGMGVCRSWRAAEEP